MMSGYVDNPTATAVAFDEDGWLMTGDITYTRKGKVCIIDRAKVSNSCQSAVHSFASQNFRKYPQIMCTAPLTPSSRT